MKLNIQSKLLIPVIFSVALVMAVSTWVTNSSVQRQLGEIYTEELNIIADVMLRNVQTASGSIIESLAGLSKDPQLEVLLTAAENKSGVAEAQKMVNPILEQYNMQFADYKVLTLAGTDGLAISSSRKESIGTANISQRAYFADAMKGKPAVSEPLVSMETNEKSIVMAVPVMVGGRAKGVLYGVVPIKTIVSKTTEGVKIGKTGFPFIMDHDLLMVAHPVESNIQERSFKGTAWAEEAVRQKNGNMRYLTAAGLPRLMSFRADDTTGWVVMAAVDESEFASVTDYLRNLGLGALCVGVLLIGLIIFLIVRPIIQALKEGVTFAQSVADGDLNKELSVRRSDELGVLSDALRTMVSSLKTSIEGAQQESERAHQQSERATEAMKQAEVASAEAQTKTNSILHAAEELEKVASVVSVASDQLAAQIAQSERGATEQAARVTETATAMEEMNSTVLEVAKNASTASDVSVATRLRAEAGADVVSKAVTSIQQVQNQSLRLKDDMNTLDENAKAISQIMGVISDIADQTNLLALNAAIEAARAGDAGRGFAVVADEVRKLAEKTMSSTTDVGNAIRAIQQSATQSIAQVDGTVKTIEEATGFATQSGQALKEIVTMVDNTADQVRAIATASEEQSSTSDEINRSIAHVNNIAGETARAMAEAAQAVTSLAQQAGVLTRLIDSMKRI